ncbi:MAG: hypothetical protein QOH91_3383 [Mycobacterium sp.]|nr:hypothetical protein [Mycobacterium sp.]
METEVREWLDRLAIQDLISRYSDAVTRADWQQCEALFCPDAVWESPQLGLHFEERASFIEMLTATTAYGLLIQTPHASVITLTGTDQAQATTTIHEFIRGDAVADSPNLEQYGIYYDDVARIDGEWKFARRLFVPIYAGTGRVTGDLLTPRSALLRPDGA